MFRKIFFLVLFSVIKTEYYISSDNNSSNDDCIEQPKLLISKTAIDHNHHSTDLMNIGDDFLDIHSGSNLTLHCFGHRIDDNSGDSIDGQNQITWILPEYHPNFDPIPPEYIRIEEEYDNDTDSIHSRLYITGLETTDVGYYTCTWNKYLHLLQEDSLQKHYNSIYIFVTDEENLFVKQLPIMMAIFGRPVEIGCRSSSSLAVMSLWRIDSITGTHHRMSIKRQSSMAANNKSIDNNSNNGINYDPRRGFILSNITDDRFICRAHLSISTGNNSGTNSDEPIINTSSDHNIIVHFTNGIDYAGDPIIRHEGYSPMSPSLNSNGSNKQQENYSFVGKRYHVSCETEKSHSSHIFIKWQFINQSCYETRYNSIVRIGDVETIQINKLKELVRLNLTLENITKQYDGVRFQCIITDVSMRRKTNSFKLKIYDEPYLELIPRSQLTQVHRCNSEWRFEIEIKTMPSEIEQIKLEWLKYHQELINNDNDNNETKSITKIAVINPGDTRISWSKDYVLKKHDCFDENCYCILASIWIKNLVPADTGRYLLMVDFLNGMVIANQSFDLHVFECHISDLDENFMYYILALALFISIMLMFIFLLANRIRIEKRAKKELQMLSINLLSSACMDSKETVTIDPNLPIHEQIDLLKYDHRWEVFSENIQFGQELGQGAFGKVIKATAYGLPKCPKVYHDYIIENDHQNQDQDDGITVAVKMIKNRLNNGHNHVGMASHMAGLEQLKALSGELKVLNYIGYHANIVNLLGACTTRLIKGELFILMEYCCNGNMQQYLHRNRRNFLNNNEPPKINKTNLEGVAETTFFDNDDETKIMINGKQQQRQLPFRIVDLLVYFSYQIANGMDYLSSKKVVHRDLAARNILVCDNNIVKISDFGLAWNGHPINNNNGVDEKSSVNRSNVEKLPIKWMAIESLRDKIFDTKSDVWSYGVLLWEMFSLGSAPYPGLNLDQEFFQKIINGYRMSKPLMATNEIYQLMKQCWDEFPDERPDFGVIARLLEQQLSSAIAENNNNNNDGDFLKIYRQVVRGYDEARNEQILSNGHDVHDYEGLDPIEPQPDISSEYLSMSDKLITSCGMTAANHTIMVDDSNRNYVRMESNDRFC